jgi:N-acetylneuraminic acid mutarotase
MKTNISLRITPLAMLVLILTAVVADAAQAQWELRAPIPHHVYGHSAAVVDGRLHILGGCHTPNWQIPARYHQVYDPATDDWTQAAELPVPVAWAMPAVHQGRIYLFGGGVYQPPQGITSTTKSWVFDPVANRWDRIRDLPAPIMNGFAAAVGDSIYIGLGYNRQGGEGRDIVAHYRDTYRYDPLEDTYQRLAEAPEFGCYAAVGVRNGRIYVVSGAEIEIGFHDMEDYVWAEGALKYDPPSDRWTRIDAPRTKQRVFYMTQCTSSAVFGPKLFAVGGMGAKRDRTTVADYFDMDQEVFRELPSIPTPRCCGGGGVVGHLLILAGGFYGAAEDLGDVCDTTWALDLRRLPER